MEECVSGSAVCIVYALEFTGVNLSYSTDSTQQFQLVQTKLNDTGDITRD